MLQPRQSCLLRGDWHRRHTRALRRPLRQQRWLLLRLARLRRLDLSRLLLHLASLRLLLHLASLRLLLSGMSSLDLLLLGLSSLDLLLLGLSSLDLLLLGLSSLDLLLLDLSSLNLLLPGLSSLDLLLLHLASLRLLLLGLNSLDLLLLMPLSSRRSRHHALCHAGLCNILLDGRRSLLLLADTTAALLRNCRGSLPCLLISHSPSSVSCSNSACTACTLARSGPVAARW